MSLLTCLKCTARRAVGLLTCPHCGSAEHAVGDTVSGPEGAQGQAYVPPAYADTMPTVELPDQAVPMPAVVVPAVNDQIGVALPLPDAPAAAAAEPPAAETSAP